MVRDIYSQAPKTESATPFVTNCRLPDWDILTVREGNVISSANDCLGHNNVVVY